MSVKNFVKTVVSDLNLDKFSSSSKKKSIKNLLKKLKDKRVKILKQMKKETDKVILAQLKEELEIISMQITKGKKISNTFKKKKNDK